MGLAPDLGHAHIVGVSDAHAALVTAVVAAYGCDEGVSDDGVLQALRVLNL